MTVTDAIFRIGSLFASLCEKHGWVLPVGVLIASIATTAVVYGESREFSFMMDDAFDTTWTEQRSYTEILTERFPGFGYYRPLPFLIFKAAYDLTGSHNTEVLRTIALAAHAITAWLLYLVLRRLIRSEWSIAATSLFLVFPFSYQVLSVIGAMGHVLVTMLLLTSLLFWYEGRRQNSGLLLGSSVWAAIVAVWTIEYGVIGLPLLLGLELWIRHQTGERISSRARLPYFLTLGAAQLVYMLLWFGTDRPESDPVAAEDVVRNGVFWLQIVAFPATRFLNIVFSGDAPGYWIVLFVSLTTIAIAMAAHLFLQQAKLAFAALAVSFICFLPSMLMLTHEYVLSGPRLLYVASPAIVAFWALLGRSIFIDQRVNWGWRAGILLLVVVTLLHSNSFIERRLAMFQTSNQVIEELITVAESRDGAPLLIMNAPAWFSFHSLIDQEYPIGHLGVQGIPSYVGLDGLYYAATGASADIDSGALAPDVSGWTYAWSPHGSFMDHDQVNERLRAGYELGVLKLTDDGATMKQPGRIASNAAGSDISVATFSDRIDLNQVDWFVQDGVLEVETYWRIRGSLAADYHVSFDAVDNTGGVAASHRDYALAGMSPPRLWMPGDVVVDRLQIELANDVTIHELRVSLINTADDSRLEITDSVIETDDDHRLTVQR